MLSLKTCLEHLTAQSRRHVGKVKLARNYNSYISAYERRVPDVFDVNASKSLTGSVNISTRGFSNAAAQVAEPPILEVLFQLAHFI